MRKNYLSILSVSILLSLVMAGCSGWLKSAARDDYKAAKDKLNNNEYAEGLLLGTQSVLADPVQKRPKKFMYKNFDEAMEKIRMSLKSSEGTQNADESARRHDIYSYLVKIYANIGKMKLPLKHPKGKWKWETEIIDYTDELEASRIKTRKLYYARGENFLGQFNSKLARKAFNSSINYANQEEKDEFKEKIFNTYETHANTYDKSDVINEAYSAYMAYDYALEIKENQEIIDRKAATALHISDLYVGRGQQLEAENTLESLKKASVKYESALEWNSKNETASELLATVKDKIAEKYYQKGLAAQNSHNRNLTEIKSYFENANKWSPGYKDANKRFHVFNILLEIQNTQAKIDKSLAEHAKIDRKVKVMTGDIRKLNDNTQKLVAITTRVDDMQNALQKTIYVLQPLNVIPFVNVASKPMSIMLKGINTPMKATNNVMQRGEKVTIRPMIATIEKANTLVSNTQGVVDETGRTFKGTKTTFATAEQCLMAMEKEEDFEKYTGTLKEFNSIINPMNKSLAEINTQLDKLSSTSKTMSQLGNSFDQLDQQMSSMDPALHEINKVTDKIDDVLKKEVSLGPWSVSAEKALKEFEKLEGLAMDLVKPYLEELTGIQVPQPPGKEQFEKMMAMVEAEKEKIDDQVRVVQKQYNKCKNYKDRLVRLSNRLNEPCYHQQQSELIIPE